MSHQTGSLPRFAKEGDSADEASAMMRKRIPPAEWDARVELAALYRLAGYFRWTDLIYTHISLRVPGEETFLLNPFGYLYNEVTASSLVKVDISGEVIDDPTGLGINRAGFVIHGAIHQARDDARCVMHTHTRAGAAVSAQEQGLLPISQHAAFLIGRVGYHDFEGVAVHESEQERLAQDLGSRPALILRNHGLLTVGRSVAEAFVLMHTLERACDIQIAAQGAELRFITPQSVTATQEILDHSDGSYSRDWAAMLRLVGRIAPEYAT